MSKKISSVKDLVPDARNANKGTERGAEQLKRSLGEYGAGRSVLIDRKGRLIAGNKTAEAAAALGSEKVVVVPTDGKTLVAVQRTDLDLADPKLRKRAQELAIADNRIGELNLEWDPAVLAEISKECDLSGLFSADELEQLLKDSAPEGGDDGAEPKLDKAVELQKKWKTARGQIWQIGRHRLVCGDATDAADWSMIMDGERASMCFTDPPWNVGIGGDSNPRHRQRPLLANDSQSPENFSAFIAGFADRLGEWLDGDLYCVLGASEWPTLDARLRDRGFHWSATVIWIKDLFVLGRSKYHRRYEPIWYGWPKNGKSSFGEARDLDDVWEIPRPRRSDEHPTMKPVELCRRAIQNSSRIGSIVVDCFLGGGATMVAAQQLERRCYAMEIEPKYVAVALERLWEMGLKPELGRDVVQKAG